MPCNYSSQQEICLDIAQLPVVEKKGNYIGAKDKRRHILAPRMYEPDKET